MATVDLQTTSGEPTQVLEAKPETTLVPPPAQPESNDLVSDMDIPYLNIGQRTGELTDSNPGLIGHFVYDKVFDLGEEVEVIFVSRDRFWMEDVEYGSNDIPDVFRSMEEVRAFKSDVVDVVDLNFLFATTPATKDNVLVGTDWVPAKARFRKGSVKATNGVLLRHLAGFLKNDLPSGKFKLKTTKKTFNSNSWYAPTLTPAGPVDEATRDEIREKFGV
jgi:hypothetical protein